MDTKQFAAMLQQALKDHLQLQVSHTYSDEGNYGEHLHWITLKIAVQLHGEIVTETEHTIELRTKE